MPPRKKKEPESQTTIVGNPDDPTFTPTVLTNSVTPVVQPAIDLTTLDPDFKPGLRATYLAEVFTTLPSFKSDEERVIWLRHNNKPSVRYLLQLAFSPLKWVVDEPQFTYHKGRPGSAPTELTSELRRLYLFIEGCADNLKQDRRQKLFVDMLESLDHSEAQLVINLMNKTYDTYGLTRALVEASFPGLLTLSFTGKFIR